MSMKDKEIKIGDFLVAYWSSHYGFDLSFELCGYFDNRPRIVFKLFYPTVYIILPFKNSWTDECDPPKWGIAYHNQTFWVYRGGKGNMRGGNKWWTFNMPWQFVWIRTSKLRNDGTWEHEGRGNRKDFWMSEWDKILWHRNYKYNYKLRSGEVQKRTATISVEERECRRRWFKWLSWGAKIVRSIDVKFDDEVGEETGSWKGGCIGCGYTLLPDETPLQCLRRMEKERKF